MTGAAPFRIVTERLVLRCYEPGDAPLVKEAIDSSLEHLREFMDWAWAAPEPLEVIEERLGAFGELFADGRGWVYGLFSADESEYLGGAGLHPRLAPGALEIGYWIRASRVRQGLATEAAGALTQIAFSWCDVEHVEIHVDPANGASLGVPAKLGYSREGVLAKRLPPVKPGGERRDMVVFSLSAEELAGSPCAEAFVEAFSSRTNRSAAQPPSSRRSRWR
ncbi:MAG TPA: GNAT family protein [Gaiellaceae bacterium]|nr:GNAT family protein [Gaiellaceae bacterium]